MREILFRGFHECENGNQKAYYNGEWHKGEWVYGYYVKAERLCGGGYEHFIIQEEANGSNLYVAPETICPYTGLTDKNGKKIFDGDIVKKSYSKFETDYLAGVVVYRENVSSYMVKVIDSICPMSTKMRYLGVENHSNSYEIIGNKFENPELLEVEE